MALTIGGTPDAAEETIVSNNVQLKFENDLDEKPDEPLFDVSNEGEDGFFFGSAIGMTNAQRMAEENESKEFDIRQRFWQAWLVDKLIHTEGDQLALKLQVEFASNLNRHANAESLTWMKEIEQNFMEDSIIYQPFTEATAQAFDNEQKYFDNVQYQREDTQAACELLGIPWAGDETIFRMPGMAFSATMTFWQPVGVKALLDFRDNPMTRACVLADVVGLGKTWVLICYMLKVCIRLPCFLLLISLLPKPSL